MLTKWDFPYIRFHNKHKYLSVVTVGVFCANETVFLTTGTALVLVCKTSIRDRTAYPTWSGPPNFTRYNAISGQFNPNLGEKLNRINWTSNNIDLQLDSVTINDAGLYKCQEIVKEERDFYEIEVNVRGKFTYISKLYSPSSPSSVP